MMEKRDEHMKNNHHVLIMSFYHVLISPSHSSIFWRILESNIPYAR